ncbi:hypothetical protein COCMIDRAFT_91569 [Bipolaris oryzae ATCC 44560]|uniref:Zn(2)-C6 fungal-type domain-containing protein n=1 Tax=Bipolaris oryzae ATCC 44560 TaxID=930090 RepID=W6ZAA6_COCMI|nr:uncharacterized protein COCMIDRAFT_91569 [Bipolaris oryzae ATCC 44560]EUC46920.1 hypothetical protein COCMIDRAFT_91569 [Bipolaris oryzae ATCC 44560]
MPLRKSHSKSRFGCLPCKKRHIKCGEESPSCNNCTNRRVQCVYKSPHTPDDGSSRSSTSMSRSETLSGELHTARTPITVTRAQELHLMAHYITSTCETVSHGKEDMHVWQQIVPDEAIHHEFLLDGILALSSLHYAWKYRDSRLVYSEIAMNYHASALKGFRDALNCITDEKRCALFAFSVILNVLALAFPNICPTSEQSSREESVVTLIELLQGLRFIIRGQEDFAIHLAKYQPLWAPFIYPAHLPTPKPADEVAAALARLRERTNSIQSSIDAEQHRSYLAGIESLEEIFGQMNKDPTYLGQIIGWPTTVSPTLLDLFKQEDPMAQLIFIHYGALLLYTRDRWWGRNTGVRLIESLSRSVSNKHPDWVDLMQWANAAAVSVQQD